MIFKIAAKRFYKLELGRRQGFGGLSSSVEPIPKEISARIRGRVAMKKASVFAVAAASSAAFAAGSVVPSHEGCEKSGKEVGSGSPKKGSENGKFAPRFDGLRFIETLVTAHR